MDICIISIIYPTDKNITLGIFVHNQAKEMVNQGHKVNVLTTGVKGMKKEELVDGVKINRVLLNEKGNGLIFSLKIAYNVIKNRKNYDIIHSHFLGVSTILAGFICKCLRLPFIVTSHGTSWEYSQKTALKRLLIREALRFPDKIICVSEATKRILEPYTSIDKLKVINNGISLPIPSKPIEDFKNELGLSNKKIILSVSDLVEKKSIDTIIRAMHKLIKKFPDLYYIIIGEGEEKERLVKLVNDLKLQNHIRFEKFMPQKELVNYYNICDLFVLMSRETKDAMESFGIAYIEASYFGKPVIGGIGGGTADAVEDGKSGFLVDTKNPEELIKKVELLFDNPKQGIKMGKYGRQRVKGQFLLSQVVKKIIQVYEGEAKKC